MLFLKLTAVLFLILLLPAAMIITALLRLQFQKLSATDLALPLYAGALYIVSSKLFYHNLLPLYGLLLSLSLLGLCLFFVSKQKSFRYRRILKIFWRLSFFMTFLLYLALVIYLFAFA